MTGSKDAQPDDGRVTATLDRMYPDGYRCCTWGGRRVPAPVVYPWTGGLRSLVNGSWHLFDSDGSFISEGPANVFRGGDRAAA
ncbi:MAG TPA: hypothetical protein VM487_26360 [Phycisphaerae bacterium]|nr:hypothetical protein [Phycisphaerae bacterium]